MQDPETISAVSNATASLSDTLRELLRPWNIRREAKAKAYEMKTLANARLQTASIDAKVIEIQHRNLASILQKSTQYVPDIPIDSRQHHNEVKDDWLLSFLEIARNVSDEDMQELLAAILAGEYECPGAFSIRTLQLLKNMSSAEARKFTELVSYCVEIDSKILIVTKKDCNNVPFTVLMDLEDTGLINHNVTGLSVKGTDLAVIKHGIWVANISGFSSSELELGCNASLTRSGQELFEFMKRRGMLKFDFEFFSTYIKSFEKGDVKTIIGIIPPDQN